jgi:hypothetical protein
MLSIVAIAVLCGILFIPLKPRFKALVSLFFLMDCFNVAPEIWFGISVWDFGIVALFFMWAELCLRDSNYKPDIPKYMLALKTFIVWMVICFLYSLLVYRYNVLDTIKSSRQMILGYLSILAFRRLFISDPGSMEFMFKWIFRFTLLLMMVIIYQYIKNEPIMYGLIREFNGKVRAVPIFLTLCMYGFFQIYIKFICGNKVARTEVIYALLAVVVISISFTRGIYLATAFALLCSLLIILKRGAVHGSSVVKLLALIMVFLPLLGYFGALDGLTKRFGNAITLITQSGKLDSDQQKNLDDNFTGRMLLAAERFSLVAGHNPIIGYGYLHEERVPNALRLSLHYGGGNTVITQLSDQKYYFDDGLALYSADIAWPDIVLTTGFVGLGIFIWFIIVLVRDFFSNAVHRGNEFIELRTALFVQIIVYILLMFNSNYFYSVVHLPGLMIAAYSTLNRLPKSIDQVTVPHLHPNLVA